MKFVWAGVIAALTLLFTAGFAVSANKEKLNVKTTPPHPAMEKALFAGGCFWCMEKPFEEHDEGLSVASGSAGSSWPSLTELEEKS